jgi:hypothetical protein
MPKKSRGLRRPARFSPSAGAVPIRWVPGNAPAINVRCPKCGAAPGRPCASGGRIGTALYPFHKKRETAVLLGDPSTESLTVPVRLSVLKARARVGPVDSALKSQHQA